MISMNQKKQNGFTLVELVIIMVILGILAAVAVPRLGSSIDASEVAQEEAVIGNLRSALEVYAMDQVVLTSSKSYPSNPFAALDDKSRINLTGTTENAGTPWGWNTSTNKIYHLRNDGSQPNWTYNSSTGEIF
jgi:prepilin-type N-terminal cleavage/methylation domain-containing protein